MKQRTSSDDLDAQKRSSEGISNVRSKPPHIYDNITRRLLQFGKLTTCKEENMINQLIINDTDIIHTRTYIHRYNTWHNYICWSYSKICGSGV